MEKKETYTFEEIILGLRKEYLAHQQALDELKKLCMVDSKKVQDFRFGVCKEEFQDNPILKCYYDPKMSALQKKIEEYQRRIGYYVCDRHISIMATDNNRYYFLRGEQFPIHIPYLNTGAFYTQATSILNSEFSNKLSSGLIDNLNGVHGALDIDPQFINFFISQNYILPHSSICFTPYTDSLKVTAYDGDISSAEVSEALQVKFAAEALSPYQLGLLESSPDIKKPFILEKQFKAEKVELFIAEEEKGFVLSKTKKQ